VCLASDLNERGWGYGMTDGGWELLRRFHAHLRDVWSLLALSIRGGWVEDASGLTCVATGSTSPSFNPALSGRNLVDPRSALDGASERYRAAGRMGFEPFGATLEAVMDPAAA
jgi:hypothetical protein